MTTGKKSEKRKLWVEAMLANGGDQTKAAAAVGHKPGEAATRAGHRYAHDPVCKKMLKARRAAALKDARITANDTITSLGRDVNFNPRKLLQALGTPPELLDQLDDDTLQALRGVKLDPVVVGRGKRAKVLYKAEVKFPEKTAAREQAMKHFGLYERDNKQKPFYTPPALIIQGVPGKGK